MVLSEDSTVVNKVEDTTVVLSEDLTVVNKVLSEDSTELKVVLMVYSKEDSTVVLKVVLKEKD